MKILYDHQIFEMQKFGGISRYFFELLKQFRETSHIKPILSLLYSNNLYIKEFDSSIDPLPDEESYPKFLKGMNFKGKGRLYHLIRSEKNDRYAKRENKRHTIERLKEGNFDVFHATFYDDYFLKYIGNKPYILTVHDLIYQVFPEYFLVNGIADKSQALLENASALIAISESTKKDLISFFSISEEKIHVIHHGYSNFCERKGGESRNLPDKYILFVGQRWMYKNFYFFLYAFKALLHEFKDIFLVCTGDGFSYDENIFFKKLGVSDRVFHIYATDSELEVLYRNAECFVFPSLYEGFGMPILESFNFECPVILSNTSSLPEIAGDAAVYFQPKNLESLIDALKAVISNEALKEELRKKGIARLNSFSWEKCALKTAQVYMQISDALPS